MGKRNRRNKNRNRNRNRNNNGQQKITLPAEPPIESLKFSEEERAGKAKEVLLHATMLGFEKLIAFRRLSIILDLWVKFGREHVESLPIQDRILEIKLYQSKCKESSVILKQLRGLSE